MFSLYKLVLSAVCYSDGKLTGTEALVSRGWHVSIVDMVLSLLHKYIWNQEACLVKPPSQQLAVAKFHLES